MSSVEVADRKSKPRGKVARCDVKGLQSGDTNATEGEKGAVYGTVFQFPYLRRFASQSEHNHKQLVARVIERAKLILEAPRL